MVKINTELKLGLSEYSLNAYVSLAANHPVNGSQLSRQSGIPRARIYDVLETLIAKGFVIESSKGMYSPIPSREFIRRLRQDFEIMLFSLEEKLKKARQKPEKDVIWTIKGYAAAMGKAEEMIDQAKEEIYIRMAPEEGQYLDAKLMKAELRGVQVKYISMKPGPRKFKFQIIHPCPEPCEQDSNTRFFDVVVDKEEILCGMFIYGDEEGSVINWGQNKRFVLSGRDSLRHDFYHYFLHKIKNEKKELTQKENELYEFIQKDI
ncbi:MAG: TrmB family transcriptional regulator [Desulfobacula sp.]|nr:TrmB family transcriptional regulator [Desulfobacula sp.]